MNYDELMQKYSIMPEHRDRFIRYLDNAAESETVSVEAAAKDFQAIQNMDKRRFQVHTGGIVKDSGMEFDFIEALKEGQDQDKKPVTEAEQSFLFDIGKKVT
jgi:hypothetical protein